MASSPVPVLSFLLLLLLFNAPAIGGSGVTLPAAVMEEERLLPYEPAKGGKAKRSNTPAPKVRSKRSAAGSEELEVEELSLTTEGSGWESTLTTIEGSGEETTLTTVEGSGESTTLTTHDEDITTATQTVTPTQSPYERAFCRGLKKVCTGACAAKLNCDAGEPPPVNDCVAHMFDWPHTQQWLRTCQKRLIKKLKKNPDKVCIFAQQFSKCVGKPFDSCGKRGKKQACEALGASFFDPSCGIKC